MGYCRDGFISTCRMRWDMVGLSKDANAKLFNLAWDSISKAESGEVCDDMNCSWCRGEPTWEDDDLNRFNEPNENCPVWRKWHDQRNAHYESTGYYNPAIAVRDKALAVLSRMGLSWDENPLRPQHDQPVHADGRDLSDDEYEKLMQNDAFNQAVWDLTNVWALSNERREKMLEYARQQMIGGFNDG